METKQFVLLVIDYLTKNRIAVIRLFEKLIGEDGGGSKIIALNRSFKPYIYIRPKNVDECVKELDLLRDSKLKNLKGKMMENQKIS